MDDTKKPAPDRQWRTASRWALVLAGILTLSGAGLYFFFPRIVVVHSPNFSLAFNAVTDSRKISNVHKLVQRVRRGEFSDLSVREKLLSGMHSADATAQEVALECWHGVYSHSASSGIPLSEAMDLALSPSPSVVAAAIRVIGKGGSNDEKRKLIEAFIESKNEQIRMAAGTTLARWDEMEQRASNE